MTDQATAAMTRRTMLFGVATALCAAGPGVAAPTILRGAGDIRRIDIDNPRTGEKLRAVYWVEGAYVPEALREVDFIMRDWREDAVTRIDPRTLDIIAATHALLGTSEPFTLYSGYRTARTNRMLRRRSRGVASNSYHVRAMAADIHLKGRSVRQIASAAASLKAGGVGKYSRSDFVHVDCGPLRDWGR